MSGGDITQHALSQMTTRNMNGLRTLKNTCSASKVEGASHTCLTTILNANARTPKSKHTSTRGHSTHCVNWYVSLSEWRMPVLHGYTSVPGGMMPALPPDVRLFGDPAAPLPGRSNSLPRPSITVQVVAAIQSLNSCEYTRLHTGISPGTCAQHQLLSAIGTAHNCCNPQRSMCH